jgi:hypothetical protein
MIKFTDLQQKKNPKHYSVLVLVKNKNASTIIYKVVDKIIMYQIPRHYLDIYPTSILLQPSDPYP